MTVDLDYLKTILGGTLDDTRPVTAPSGNSGEDEYEDEAEDVPLQLILDKINRWFTSEAEAKGLI